MWRELKLMKLKFKFYSFSAKFRTKEIVLYHPKAIFMEDQVDIFIHLPFFTVGLVISEEEEK